MQVRVALMTYLVAPGSRGPRKRLGPPLCGKCLFDGELGLVILRRESRLPHELCLEIVRSHHRDHRAGPIAWLERLTLEQTDRHVDCHAALDDRVVVRRTGQITGGEPIVNRRVLMEGK